VLLFLSFLNHSRRRARVRETPLDDISTFKDLLDRCDGRERAFMLDLMIVCAAFDGKLSRLERETLRALFSAKEFDIYQKRLVDLIACLKGGMLQRALQLSKLDFELG